MLEDLAERLARRTRRRLERPRRAAVLVPLVDDGGPLRLLLTRRTDRLPTHKGDVAFPGGMTDPADADAVDTALREAEEEIALPRDRVEVLGHLDDFPTVTNQVVVTPVVARVADVSRLRPAPAEVARIFTIPVETLRDPAAWEVRRVHRLGRRFPVYFFHHDGETLWGLSAYITLHLLDVSRLGAPLDLPKLRE